MDAKADKMTKSDPQASKAMKEAAQTGQSQGIPQKLGPNEAATRATYISTIDPAASTGLALEAEAYTGPTAEGYEFTAVANPTPNWRFTANYSYTDYLRRNVASEIIAWYGLKPAEGNRSVQGASQDATGRWVVDRNAFLPEGAVVLTALVGCLKPLGVATPCRLQVGDTAD